MSDDSDDRWWVGAIGGDPTSEPYVWARHTEISDSTNEDEIVRVNPDTNTSLWIVTRTDTAGDPLRSNTADRNVVTTYTEHAANGDITSSSSTTTREWIVNSVNGQGKTWNSTFTENNGSVTLQRGVTFEGPAAGHESVETTRSDGSVRKDMITWSPESSDGTRVTVETNANNVVTSTEQDSVKRDDNLNWVHDPDDSESDGPGDEPAQTDDGTGESPGDQDGLGSVDGEGGEFGPGGPDAGASPAGVDGDPGEDVDEDDDGPGVPHPPGPTPIPHPVD